MAHRIAIRRNRDAIPGVLQQCCLRKCRVARARLYFDEVDALPIAHFSRGQEDELRWLNSPGNGTGVCFGGFAIQSFPALWRTPREACGTGHAWPWPFKDRVGVVHRIAWCSQENGPAFGRGKAPVVLPSISNTFHGTWRHNSRAISTNRWKIAKSSERVFNNITGLMGKMGI